MEELNTINPAQQERQILQPGMKYCKFCGEQIDAECVVCPKCGKQVEQLKQEPTQAPNIVINNDNSSKNVNTNVNRNAGGLDYPYKSRMVALILAIFLGWLGAHRFYVGKIGTGIIWLLTLGLFGIGWLVDIVVIAIGGFRDVAKMPLK